MLAVDEKESKIKEIIHMIQESVGKENVFLEIIAQSYTETTEHKKINDLLLAIAEQEDIPCIVNNVYCYPNKADKQAWEVALAIKDGMKIYDENRRKPKGQFYIMTQEEITSILQDNGFPKHIIQKLIDTNNKIADDITTEIELNQALFPNYETPDDIKALYEQHKEELEMEE
jgi:DNA polymerase III alpha subunit